MNKKLGTVLALTLAQALATTAGAADMVSRDKAPTYVDNGARDGVKIGYDIMNGKKPKDSVMLLPVPLITKANVKDYPGWVK